MKLKFWRKSTTNNKYRFVFQVHIWVMIAGEYHLMEEIRKSSDVIEGLTDDVVKAGIDNLPEDLETLYLTMQKSDKLMAPFVFWYENARSDDVYTFKAWFTKLPRSGATRKDIQAYKINRYVWIEKVKVVEESNFEFGSES